MAGAAMDVNQPLLTKPEQKRSQTPQQLGCAEGDQTNDYHGSEQAPPSDQMQAAMPPVHQDNTYLAEGTAAAALIAWHEQSCLQTWWLLSGTVMVILNAVSLALNIKSMNSYSADQWRLVHVISFVVLCGYFGILSGQLYGMCLVRSIRLLAVHNKIAAPHCAGSPDLRSKVKACRVLGCMMFAFSGITAILWLVLGKLEHDIPQHIGMFILAMWHTCHAMISLTVAIEANHVKHLLNPVSSGMVML